MVYIHCYFNMYTLEFSSAHTQGRKDSFHTLWELPDSLQSRIIQAVGR